MQKLYRNAVLMGALAFGLAACGDDLTIVDPTPQPPSGPGTPNIITFTVAPTNATIAVGQTVQASYQIVTKNGAGETVSYASSNTGVATVDATSGLITAVSQGNAVITATATVDGQTATAQIGITVRNLAPAQVSIQRVTHSNTDTPVDIGNVKGQIEVTLNFDPGEQDVSEVAVYIGNKKAAWQTYASSPAAGPIVLSINTANYVKNTTAGTTTVDYFNGPTKINGRISIVGQGEQNAQNEINIVLNNEDGWAADMSKPTQNANASSGLTYWGGPGDAGLTTTTAYPVIYTQGRSVSSVVYTVGGCPLKAFAALPFRTTFGYTTPSSTNCGGPSGYEWTGGDRDNVVIVSAIDNTNNPYPVGDLIPNTVVLGSTPDSLRFDWRSPSVSAPSITRTAPAVTGWVNASVNFVGFSSTDNGVGIRATRDRKAFYDAPNCGGATAVAMPNGTGADIPECATNFIGGAVGLAGTAPYQAYGTESDRLGNLGTSGKTSHFGVDKTAPSIRWGTVSAAPALPDAVTADTVLTNKPVAGTDEFRAEYLDDRAGFYNAGAPTGVAPAQIAAQRHRISAAGHVNPVGTCLAAPGAAATPGVGSAFVTAPTCALAYITAGGPLRVDGWQAGQRVDVPQAESYYGYTTNVIDAAGNVSSTLFRKVAVNAVDPFASLIGVTGTLTDSAFNFSPTFADSVEIVANSFRLDYPQLPTVSEARYPRTMSGVIFDDAITSPFNTLINPPTGTPYAVRIEATNATAFPASNIVTAPGATVKPVNVQVWAWNPGSVQDYAPLPNPAASGVTAIPALLVADADSISRFNTLNPTIAVNHWRVIPTVDNSNWFGSTVSLRAQAVSPTNAPNPPFVRVDFYRLDAGGTWWNYIGSSSSALGTDQGTYRSWVWSLADGSYSIAWDGSDQADVAAGDDIIAVGVTVGGSGIVTQQTTMTP